jgi:hypothetical protein
MSNRAFPNGSHTEATPDFQSGSGLCACCSAAQYYDHPVSPFWGGAKKKATPKKKASSKGARKQRGGADACSSLTAPQEVATENMQMGEVLYGGAKKRGRGRPRKSAQKGGADSLIPVAPSTPADLAGQGPFTDQHANWMQRGTGSGVETARPALPQDAFAAALETSGGARKKKAAPKKKATPKKKSQKGGVNPGAVEAPLNTAFDVLKSGGAKKRGPGRPRKTQQRGAGSDWSVVAHSRGPINYPTQSDAMFRTFNKSAPMISNADLYWAPLDSPMFKTDAPVGYNNYNPF